MIRSYMMVGCDGGLMVVDSVIKNHIRAKKVMDDDSIIYGGGA